jgi:hypothetical protein
MLKNEENCNVRINCIHPGIVKTDLYTHVGWVKVLDKVSNAMMKTAEQGCDTVVHAAMSSEIEGQGVWKTFTRQETQQLHERPGKPEEAVRDDLQHSQNSTIRKTLTDEKLICFKNCKK